MSTQKPTPAPESAPAPDAAPAPVKKGPKQYWIVNRKGTIHQVTREHARERLREAGWRMATQDEVAALAARGGHQTADKPICKPWSPDPDAQLDEE